MPRCSLRIVATVFVHDFTKPNVKILGDLYKGVVGGLACIGLLCSPSPEIRIFHHFPLNRSG
jgi:hypothetical protein